MQRGHIYIAQPPLYKVKHGSHEQYVKDDEALNLFLLHLALEDAKLFVNHAAPPLAETVLENMAIDYSKILSVITRLAKKYPQLVLESLIFLPRLTQEQLINREAVLNWAGQLQTLLQRQKTYGVSYQVVTKELPEKNLSLPLIKVFTHGAAEELLLGVNFFLSAEYITMANFSEKVAGLFEEGAYVERKNNKRAVSSFQEAFNWLIAESKKGVNIQRYKGLGEMNAEQLWETTMCPESRNLLQVTVHDAIAVDQMFTTLMGDQVEPRRIFIEQKALEVVNLDV